MDPRDVAAELDRIEALPPHERAAAAEELERSLRRDLEAIESGEPGE